MISKRFIFFFYPLQKLILLRLCFAVDRQKQRRQRDARRADRMVQPGRRHTPIAGHAGHGFVKWAALAWRSRGHARPGELVQLVDGAVWYRPYVYCTYVLYTAINRFVVAWKTDKNRKQYHRHQTVRLVPHQMITRSEYATARCIYLFVI